MPLLGRRFDVSTTPQAAAEALDASTAALDPWRMSPSQQPKNNEARDVVDLALLGDIAWIAEFGFLKVQAEGLAHYWQKRDAYLEQLHAAHDEASDPSGPFKDRALVFEGPGRLMQRAGTP